MPTKCNLWGCGTPQYHPPRVPPRYPSEIMARGGSLNTCNDGGDPCEDNQRSSGCTIGGAGFLPTPSNSCAMTIASQLFGCFVVEDSQGPEG